MDRARGRGADLFFPGPSVAANHVSLPCPNSTDGGRSIYMEDHPLLACSQLHDVQLPVCAYSDMGFRLPSSVMWDGMERRRHAWRARTLTRCGRWRNARNTTAIAHRPCPFAIILTHIVLLACLLIGLLVDWIRPVAIFVDVMATVLGMFVQTANLGDASGVSCGTSSFGVWQYGMYLLHTYI